MRSVYKSVIGPVFMRTDGVNGRRKKGEERTNEPECNRAAAAAAAAAAAVAIFQVQEALRWSS